MAVEGTKIKEMMEGKTLEKDNIKQMQCLAKSEGCSIFRMENATGEGTIAMYELFPGVMLGFNDFHMDYFDSEFVPQKHVFCIDHCREGRMQYVEVCHLQK